MQQAFHWGSASTALYHLGRLEAAGLIERDFGEARGIRLPHAA
jgi:DNA-binding MarR family transcriptional regulator